ncbi:MAG: OB-fold domain-containing protein [Pseudomonadales bacterium]|jgi:hypothetical protein|nr:OB-fold domain-containing protein [Pseudomonadales bacterium]MDP6472467.1 OB-fold domain-containing protein [Pseudomonadales bacterium]MDP6828722.1 OB-fold domain-containing protein [Pseudomonadales bacterium]MDP6971481.1 OB-fold domain-containing protein [Pseudomonadales bacterium]|tara:strand:- start:61 stop:585 length:525 start_codon:yes stop_codon:yes gene_type:complete
MAALEGEYLGLKVYIDETDRENHTFFGFCGQHEVRLQQCVSCGLKRFPPTTACPFCAHGESTWEVVGGRGTVYSYGEVHHAIQPAFRTHSPYALLLVELDEQRGEPGDYDGLRIQGNLATPDGELAPPELVSSVGIGTRVKVVFRDIGSGIAIPMWSIDDEVEQPEQPWRYAIE